MRFRKSAASVLVAGLVATGLATTATPAVAAGPTAPACVKRGVIKHKKVAWATNKCGKPMHLKLVIKRGPDSGCRTVGNGKSVRWNWKIGSYGRVATC